MSSACQLSVERKTDGIETWCEILGAKVLVASTWYLFRHREEKGHSIWNILKIPRPIQRQGTNLDSTNKARCVTNSHSKASKDRRCAVPPKSRGQTEPLHWSLCRTNSLPREDSCVVGLASETHRVYAPGVRGYHFMTVRHSALPPVESVGS